MSEKPPPDLSHEDKIIWDSYVEKEVEGHAPAPKVVENFEALLKAEEAGLNGEGTEKQVEISVDPHFETQSNIPIKSPAQTRQLDKRTAEKLRKGKMPIERKLDLHGLNKSQAYAALENFITQAFNQKCRCVLVVTGKGKPKTSEGWLDPAQGALKQNVPYWLSTPPLSRDVIQAVSAQPKDGGAGALYVYLRRNRQP